MNFCSNLVGIGPENQMSSALILRALILFVLYWSLLGVTLVLNGIEQVVAGS